MFGFYDCLLFGLFAGFAALDLLAPARTFPKLPFWKAKGLASAVLYYLISTRAPFLWDGVLAEHTLIDASGLSLWAQAPLALIVLQLGVYAWHRTMHGSDILWRWFHQTHHSAERVDIWGSLYFHPLDMLGFAFVGSFMLVFVLGVSPEAVLIAFSISTFCALFQHSNLRTPRWLGYLVTRPESHAMHHQRGVHRFNYGDIPLWDLVFGTFRNPKTWNAEAGFYDGASNRLGALLIGRDISGGRLGADDPAASDLAPSTPRTI